MMIDPAFHHGTGEALGVQVSGVGEAEEAGEQRPRSGKADREARRFDKTSLRARQYGAYVHRDYAAHYFRWGWATRLCAGRSVLDVGCGPDLAFIGVATYTSAMPASYVGVDLNRLDPPARKWATCYGQTDFLDDGVREQIRARHGQFERAICLEVIEHMAKEDGLALLAGLVGALEPAGGELMISTPVYDGKARARNHVHEWTSAELRSALEHAGLEVVGRYGTFANVASVRRAIPGWAARAGLPSAAADGILAAYEAIRAFYADDVAANFLAPLIPDDSRNCVWRCRLA